MEPEKLENIKPICDCDACKEYLETAKDQQDLYNRRRFLEELWVLENENR